MSMLPRLRPRCFYDLVIQVAIVRPGPIVGGMVSVHIARDVSTRYRHRSNSLAPIARLIAAQYKVAP